MHSGRRGRFFSFGLGFRPFGFYCWGPGFFPLHRQKEEYLRMLERYKEELEEELRAVNEEIQALKQEGA